MRRLFAVTALLLAPLMLTIAPARAQKWATVWTAADQGPYPLGNPIAQPDLRFAFPASEPDGTPAGARDQSFRVLVTPALWGRIVRLRFSNVFGHKPIAFDGAFIGLQSSGANLTPGTNRPITFDRGKKSITLSPGQLAWSDPVTLSFVTNPAAPELLGRRLAVTFHVAGPNNDPTGPMTWHALALTTSYITAPGAGAIGEIEDDSAFPNSTTSTFFVDALDVQASTDTHVVVALGDGLVDGAGSTFGGDDRWTDALNRRLAVAAMHFVVVNAGISGNQVLGPNDPSPGGPSALARLDRDVLSLSGITHVIWLEGGNDVSAIAGADPDAVISGFRTGIARLKTKLPTLRVLGATITSTAGSTVSTHAVAGVEQARQTLNAAIRGGNTPFDGVLDFDAATIDRATGQLRAEYRPSSTIGGPGDGITPNRAGYIAMADAVDLKLFLPPPRQLARRPAAARPPQPPAQ